MIDTTWPSQAKAARIAGALYLVQMATAIFGESFVRGSLIVPGDAGRTAENIIESERLFRVGIATDIFTYVAVLVLVWALYVLVRPVNRNLALLAVSLRLLELATHCAATVFSLVAVTYLGGADHLKSFEPAQLHSLARVAVTAQSLGLNVGFVLVGLGSSVFAYLLLKSRYVPRLLAAWGIFASLLLSAYAITFIVYPPAVSVWMAWMIPMFIYEVGLGFWLLLKGAKLGAGAAGAA